MTAAAERNRQGGRPARRALAAALVSARDGFRMYRGTAILLGLTGAVALAVVLPVAHLVGYREGLFTSRLGLAGAGAADSGLPWISATQGPAEIRTGAVTFFFRLLLISAAATLLIAAVSVLTLSGTRALAREGEVAVRRAVGASRKALTASALAEGLGLSLLVLLTGGALGLIATHLVLGAWPGQVLPGSGGPALLVAGLTALIIVAGMLLPVVFARRQRVGEAESGSFALFLPALLQLGLCLIVLAAGAMLIRQSEQASVPQAGRAAAVFHLDAGAGDLPGRARSYDEILTELGRHPELGTVSLTSDGAITGLGTVAHATIDCGLCAEGGLQIRWRKPTVVHQFVSADSFLALGIPLLEGRRLNGTDRWGSAKVAVVSRSLARDHFQGGEAIGRTLQVADDPRDWYTVVGVVEDVAPAGFGGGTLPKYAIYLSILQHPARQVDLMLQPPAGIATMDRLIAGAVGDRARIGSVKPEAALFAAELAPLAWFGSALRYQGWAMLLIAAMGLFSLMRLWIRSAWPEFGLRRAVGARRRHVATIVLSRAGGVGLAGLALGLWFGPACWDTLADLITGLTPLDASTLLPTVLVLLGVTIAGAAGPAWSAMRATPHALLGSTGE